MIRNDGSHTGLDTLIIKVGVLLTNFFNENQKIHPSFSVRIS